MMTKNEIDALVTRAGLDGIFEIFEYSIEVPSPRGFELMPDIYSYLSDLIGAAVAAEREACAKVCEAYWPTGRASDMDKLAAAIRARGEVQS